MLDIWTAIKLAVADVAIIVVAIVLVAAMFELCMYVDGIFEIFRKRRRKKGRRG